MVKLLDPEHEGTANHRNIGKCWPIHTVSHPIRLESSVSDYFLMRVFHFPLAATTNINTLKEVLGSSVLNHGCVVVLSHSVKIPDSTSHIVSVCIPIALPSPSYSSQLYCRLVADYKQRY